MDTLRGRRYRSDRCSPTRRRGGVGFRGSAQDGAQRLLASAIEQEVGSYIERHAGELDGEGWRLVVRNGYHPERELSTGIGAVPIRQSRVSDRRPGCQFSSQNLPSS